MEILDEISHICIVTEQLCKMAQTSLCPTLKVESFLRKNLLAEINVQNTGKWVRYVSDGMLSLLVIEFDKN